MILNCNCKNEYQDKQHGKGKRIFNEMKKTDNLYKCTVCLRQQIGPGK